MLTTPRTSGRTAAPTLRVGAAVLALALVIGAVGCHAYRPMIGTDPAPGDEVRLRLAAQASAELSEQVGTQLRSVEGRMIRVTPDSLVVDAGWGALYAGTVFEGRRDTLAFSRASVLEVDRRELSRGRTALLAGGLLAVAVWVIRSLGVGTDSGDPTGPGNSPPF